MRWHFILFIPVLAGMFHFSEVCAQDTGNIDTSSSPFIYSEYSKKISMDFEDASLTDVLKIFSEQTNLNLISSTALENKRITMYLDNVPVEEALSQVLRANNLTYEIQPGSNIYIVKPLEKPDEDLITRVYPLTNATVSSAKITSTINIGSAGSEEEAGKAGGITEAIRGILTNNKSSKIIEDPRTNSLIITDIATNFPNIERTIARLDVKVPQILIEVEMLEVTKGVSELIGVKIGSTPLTFTGGKREHFYPWDQNKILNKNASASFVGDFIDNQYSVGTIDASGLSAVLQLLQTQTGTKNLARPRILTLNNEPAEIKISTNEAIGLAQSSVSSEGQATSTTAAERYETGVFLTVTPQVNLLTEEITMAILPKVIQARIGATFGNQTFKDPEERGSQSMLRVKNGETIILGGLIREDTSRIDTKVPFLGDIPLIGQAFRHKDVTKAEKELIIFITPHILAESDELNDNLATQITKPIIREQDQPQMKLNVIAKELNNFDKNK